VIFLNLVLAGLRLGLKNRQVGEKWVSDDCSYLSLVLLGQGLKKSPIGQKLDFANHSYFMQRSLLILK
jgi:hypothetical protein